ncbi:MAG TPA: nitrite reductase small subunit NirD [Bryobacteraceae bacterium]|jgi:nitrite reductase (NADH) small subunit|nr:nitrite reductase small subunit NirD [Bryobacteraceae bacterium]
MKWIRVTAAEQIPLREGRSVQIDGTEIAIFNLGDRFLAVDNACPHRGGPLCDGIVSGATVACPLHGYKICLESGNMLSPDLGVRVDTYPVRVEDGVVLLQIDPAKDRAA